jgi:EAL domain-containing protein (putative c-di-GMP-specific phosphodiesterase class I)
VTCAKLFAGQHEHDEIVPYYQPLVDLQTKRLIGFGVLAWSQTLKKARLVG